MTRIVRISTSSFIRDTKKWQAVGRLNWNPFLLPLMLHFFTRWGVTTKCNTGSKIIWNPRSGAGVAPPVDWSRYQCHWNQLRKICSDKLRANAKQTAAKACGCRKAGMFCSVICTNCQDNYCSNIANVVDDNIFDAMDEDDVCPDTVRTFNINEPLPSTSGA